MLVSMAEVVRRAATIGRREGHTTLSQTFFFERASAEALAEALWEKPLIGSHSVFGPQKRAEVGRDDERRTLRDFSPAPGFLFDVVMIRKGNDFVVQFSQPRRDVPILAGEILWSFRDVEGGAVLQEEINTELASEHVSHPLSGPKPSVRRWVFFRVGHAQVMKNATRNLAGLV